MAHMFKNASNFTISGGNFINQTHFQTSALDKLSAATAHSALHDAPARTDESRCHQHTRTNVLQKLECFAQGISEEGACVFWLYGGAGAGKSAVMQTFAERCVAQGLALGSFFFSRSDSTRNTAEVLIPTLVYQLAQLFPSSLQALDPIINGDPLIFRKSFQVQILSLFVPTLQHLVQLNIINDAPQSPRVFLIDGLDECNGPVQQQLIIREVARVCHEHCIPVKFIIASRREHVISTSFRSYEQSNHVLTAISLSEDPDAEADIRRFIEGEFLKIRLQHAFNHIIPPEWPHLYDINRLVWKSSAHFIYASTAMKYIWSEKEDPVRSLEVVLGLEVSRTVSPFSELDALYHHILGSAAHRDRVIQVLAHCLHSRLPPLPSIVCIMLDCSLNDLYIYMAGITSLVVSPKPASFDARREVRVKLLHASLGDFLRDASRSGSLYIDEDAYLASKLERCLQLLDLYSRNQHTKPDWPANIGDGLSSSLPNLMLTSEAITIISKSGHLAVAQDVLRRYSLSNFYQCQLRFQKVYQMSVLVDFLRTVHSIKTSHGLPMFPSYEEDFFDILDSHISLDCTSLAPAILPLLLLGYPARAVREILFYHCHNTTAFRLMTIWWSDKTWSHTVLDAISTGALTSIRHSVNITPKSLATAAEAILAHLFGEVQLQSSSAYSAHKSWLRRTKPGKHVATGTPRLASMFHAQFLNSLYLLEDRNYTDRLDRDVLISMLQSLSMKLRLKDCVSLDWLRRRQSQPRIVVNLLDALLWVLPKASLSEKIVLCSKRTFSRNIYMREAGLVRRVRRCLDEYSTRVQNTQLEELGQGIESGDVNALIEKTRMLYLNALD